MSGTPEPLFEGDLARTPFLHLLAQLHLKALSGTLALWPEDASVRGQDRIRFEAGAPVAGRFLAAGPPVLDKALLPFFAREGGAFAFYEGVDLAPDAGVRGKCDPLALFAASLRLGVRQDALDAVLGKLEGTPLRYKSGAELKRYALLPKEERLVEVMRAEPSTIEDLAAASELGPELGKRLVYLFVVTRALEPYEKPATTATGGTAASAGEVSNALGNAMRGTPSGGTSRQSLPGGALPSSAARPSAASPAPSAPQTAASTPTAAGRPSLPSTPGAPSRRSGSVPRRATDAEPPAQLSEENRALYLEVQARARSIDTQNYYDMLEIPRDAGTDAIRKAYFGLVKKWHPDRFPPELAMIRGDVDTIFQHLTAAHDTLTDETKRANYLRQVQDGGGTPEADRRLSAIVTAAMEQQKAEVLMRRRDFAGAKLLIEKAMELNPEEVDLDASYASCLLQMEGSDALLPEVLRRTEKVLAVSPKHDRAHLHRAMALRRVGREREALEHFQKAAEANPKNIDAVREVRLATMRGMSAPPAKDAEKEKPSGGGFLDKLFGSPKKKS